MCDMKKPDPVWVLRLTTRVKSQNISQKSALIIRIQPLKYGGRAYENDMGFA